MTFTLGYLKIDAKAARCSNIKSLEKSHLQAMAKNCEDLIEVIDQYEFDVISLKVLESAG